MKKLILLLTLAFVMCRCNEHIENTFRVGTINYDVIVIDDCEYLKSGTALAHKGNCKQCAERRMKEQEELIRKIQSNEQRRRN